MSLPQLLQSAGLALLGIVAGFAFVVQSSVNAKLRGALGSPNWAAFASYAGGTLVMLLVILALREARPAAAAVNGAPWWSWTGGAWGAVYVVIIIALLPRLGTAAVVALFVLGQMLASLAFDQLGAFGVPRIAIDPARVAGALLLVVGVVLIRR
jgi:transporter family-2 protein